MGKTKKKGLSELAQKKHSQSNKKHVNPFEVHINKDKVQVLGRKVKTDKGLPGVSRAKAIKKRKGTLLQEYKLKGKSNVFIDKRIGERNYGMTPEDKAMARFTAERIKAHKKRNIYSLNEEEILTHRGQTLEEIEKFDDPKSDDEYSDNEDGGKLGNKFVGDAHFGGGILSKPESSMSRKDLIEQLIAESKKRKAEKQKIREQTIDLTEKLDSEWKDLLPIMSASKASAEDVVEKPRLDDYDVALRELKFEARGNPSDRLKSEEEIVKEEKEKLEALEADRIARMKGFIDNQNDIIRHKSADDLDDGFLVEKVHEDFTGDKESSTVRKVKRNVNDISGEGDDDDDDDDDDNDDDDENVKEEEEGDENEEEEEEENVNEEDEAEEDDYVEEKAEENEDEEEKAEVNEDEEENEGNTEHKGDKHESEVKTKVQEDTKIVSEVPENVKGDLIVSNNIDHNNMNGDINDSENEDSEEDNLSDLKESECSSEDEHVPSKKSVKFSNNLDSAIAPNYSYDCQLKSILKKEKSVDEHENSRKKQREQEIRDDLLRRKEIMEKARQELPYTYNAPECFDELQKMLENQNPDYQAVIVDRIIKCNHWTSNGENKEKMLNLFAYLVQHISNCALEDSVENAIRCFKIFDRLCPYLYDIAHVDPLRAKNSIRDLLLCKHTEFEKNKKNYPNLDTLIIFKLVSLLFPTSDFRHPIVTPCVVFMTQILLRSRVKNRKDISKGLFICTLLLEYTTLCKRFDPATINFLRGVIYTATPKHLIQGTKIIPPFKTVGELSNLLIIDEDQTLLKIDPSDALMTVNDLVCKDLDDEFKIRALLTAVNLINEFRSHLSELEAVQSIFEPIYRLLKLNDFVKYPENFKEHVKTIRKELGKLQMKKLEYMTVAKKRPKPLRLYEPRIEPVYDVKRHRSMSRDDAEKEKLLHKYKREMKGAIREIRRDRSFLAKVQIKQQIKSDMERKRKVKEIFGEAAVQQSELKKWKKKK